MGGIVQKLGKRSLHSTCLSMTLGMRIVMQEKLSDVISLDESLLHQTGTSHQMSR